MDPANAVIVSAMRNWTLAARSAWCATSMGWRGWPWASVGFTMTPGDGSGRSGSPDAGSMSAHGVWTPVSVSGRMSLRQDDQRARKGRQVMSFAADTTGTPAGRPRSAPDVLRMIAGYTWETQFAAGAAAVVLGVIALAWTG